MSDAAEPKKRLPADAVRRGLLAGAIAFLLPGAGHLFLGARRRALVFFAVVVGTVGLGLACDGNLAVVDRERAPVLTALQVFGNVALGPAEPVLRFALYGAPIYKIPARKDLTSPARRAALDARSERSFRQYSLYGTAYLMAAGLMNLLLILDAWDIGIGRRT